MHREEPGTPEQQNKASSPDNGSADRFYSNKLALSEENSQTRLSGNDPIFSTVHISSLPIEKMHRLPAK